MHSQVWRRRELGQQPVKMKKSASTSALMAPDRSLPPVKDGIKKV
jgi:hypothetical protein